MNTALDPSPWACSTICGNMCSGDITLCHHYYTTENQCENTDPNETLTCDVA